PACRGGAWVRNQMRTNPRSGYEPTLHPGKQGGGDDLPEVGPLLAWPPPVRRPRRRRGGPNPVAVHYNLALVQLASSEPAAAQQHLEQALQHNPTHQAARSLLDRLRRLK